jgi:formate hydrogenlyase subunit 4
MKIFTVLLQSSLLILFSPLLSGIIRKLKNTMRMRQGPGVFQPYFNLSKLFSKEEVVSENASWIFSAAPAIVLSSVGTAMLIVPALTPGRSFGFMGDFITIIFLLSLGRFFLSLASLDTASAFGGMGASREMFLSSFAEPAALLSIFTVSLNAGTTNMDVLSGSFGFHLSSMLAGVALFLVTIAETSRLPIDNQETHLELTMVHEAMLLEYSGRGLAILEIASHAKQILFFSLIANILLPSQAAINIGLNPALTGFILFISKILLLGVVVSVIEVSVAKIRLFKAVDFLSFAIVLAGISLTIAAVGF